MLDVLKNMVYNTWITLILKHIGRRAAKPSIMGIHSSKSSERRRLLHVMKTMLPAKQFHDTLCLNLKQSYNE